MSHVVTVNIEVSDLKALASACKRMGLEFLEGQTSYEWYGHWVDDSPVPDGLFSPEETERVRRMSKGERCAVMNKTLGRCAHAIRVPGSRYEVGVVALANGKFRLTWDWWDTTLVPKLGGQKAEKLMQAYGVEKTRREALRMGYRVQEQAQQDGSVKLLLAR